jgi:hypothetical protein
MPKPNRPLYSGLLDKFLIPIGATPDSIPSLNPHNPFAPKLKSSAHGSNVTLTDQAARIISRAAGPVGMLMPGGNLNRQKNISGCFGPPANRVISEPTMANILKSNGDIASQHMPADLAWFKSKVGNKKLWDYKQRNPDLQDFGNYHFGYVGTRQGIPESILRAGAGVAQILAHTSKARFFTSLFDDPNDQEQIARGASDARNGCY